MSKFCLELRSFDGSVDASHGHEETRTSGLITSPVKMTRKEKAYVGHADATVSAKTAKGRLLLLVLSVS